MADTVDVFAIARDIVTNLLRNTIETYPPEWRLVQEPLQNAIDSFVDEKGNKIDMGDQTPHVTLELYVGSDLVKVIDNGSGIPLDGFRNFLILGDGTKGSISETEVKKLLKGSQGVGIKSTVFTSDYFCVDTVNAGGEWKLELNNYCNYDSQEFTGIVDVPDYVKTNKHSGTEVSIRLNGYSVWDFIKDRVDDFFETVGINEDMMSDGKIDFNDGKKPIGYVDLLKILMRYFKRDSYAGCVTRRISPDSGLPDVEFELKVICDFDKNQQDEYQIEGIKKLEAGKTYTETDCVGYLDYKQEINKLPAKLQPKVVTGFKELLESGKTSDVLTVFYQNLSKNDVKQLCGNLRKRKSTDPDSAFDFILDKYTSSKHKTALSRVNGAILFIAPRPFLKNPFVHRSTIGLSVNGLPTDITLEVSGGELGYVPSVHLILDVDEKLGYGKRNLPPRSKGIYNDLAKTLWINLRKIAKLVIGTTDSDTDKSITGNKFDLNEELSKIIVDNRDKYFEITGRISAPETEEDLISTYFYMVGKGYLQKYQWMRLNDCTIYDAFAKDPEDVGPFNIEFKYESKSLCESDERGDQVFRDMKLAIVWKLTPNDRLTPGYSVVSKEQDIGLKNWYADANYRIKRDRDYVQVIALEEIVEELLEE